jgi:hypothetical protein
MTRHREAPLPLIGRIAEQEQLARAMASGRPELIAVHGRRRIGKTHLVRLYFAKELCFETTGVSELSRAHQLRNFANRLRQETGFQHAVPRDWTEAFEELIRYLDPLLRAGGRKVVFFDELPWLASRKSGFLPAFDHFWNSWGTRQRNLIVVICGSAASWMIAKVLHQKGGLHNRVTSSIHLQPFSLSEIDAYLRAAGINFEPQQIVELAMAIGGVPFYLNQVRKGWSAAQNIHALFFAPNAPLRDEFSQVFAALFERHERHLQVIRALTKRQSGLQRNDIIRETGLETGGGLTTILEELEASGFVCRMMPLGRTTRDPYYRLLDELTLFHLRWVEKQGSGAAARDWPGQRLAPAGSAWSGYAFENLCLRHSAQIKKALGMAAIPATVSTWRHQPKAKGETGAQIDLLFDRADGVITVCEMKFSEKEFVIDKAYARDLRSKLEVFRRVTATRKAVFLAIVTTAGLRPNEYQAELVQNVVELQALFAP